MSPRITRMARTRLAEFYPYNSKRQMNDVKRQAACAVTNAKRTGTLVPKPCVECGAARSEAHHDDYSKPLDVIWLCRFHHRRRDVELRQQRFAVLTKKDSLPASCFERIAARSPFAASAGTRNPHAARRSVVCMDCTVALVSQATLEIAEAMDLEGISQSRIARRLKCSRQMVNTQFSGGFRTLKVIAAYAEALGCEARLILRPKHNQTDHRVAS